MKKYINTLLVGIFVLFGCVMMPLGVFAQVNSHKSITVTLKVGLESNKIGVHSGCHKPVLYLSVFDQKEQDYKRHRLSFMLDSNGSGEARTVGPVSLQEDDVNGFIIQFFEMTLNVKPTENSKWQYISFKTNQIPNYSGELHGFKYNGNKVLENQPLFDVGFNGYGDTLFAYKVVVTITSTYVIAGVTYIDGLSVELILN